VDIEKRTAQYVQLRDKIKALEEAHKKAIAPYKEVLERLNGELLSYLNQINADSTASASGTVYRTRKKSASIADGDLFMRYVIGSEAWDLLDRKANVTAVEEFINENSAPPPGVNFSETFTVGVRRK